MIRLEQIKLPIGHDTAALNKKIAKKLRIRDLANLPEYRIARRSLDARWKPDLFYVYTIDVFPEPGLEAQLQNVCRDSGVLFTKDLSYVLPEAVKSMQQSRPVVVGSGPAGLFCAYLLASCNLAPIVVERGECVEKRSIRVNKVWDGSSELNGESNVQFGEGGAGTFSDGKLNTLVKDKMHRNRFVLETFVKFGAPEEIVYVAKPHLGTDMLKRIVKNMREGIAAMGGTFLFGLRLSDLQIRDGKIGSLYFTENEHHDVLPEGFIRENDGTIRYATDRLVLAIGHSARDTFSMLHEKGLHMEQKNFAIGVRMEHKQEVIDRAQYGEGHDTDLPPADYKLTKQCANGRSVYSFCMCPGGFVVNASSEAGALAVNGMSYSTRDSGNANAAIIVSVDAADFGSDHPLAGLSYQRELEKKAYEIGNGCIPVQRYEDFKNNRTSTSFCSIRPVMKGKHRFANLRELFSESITDALLEAIDSFDLKISGYADPDALMSGVESRTSSPVRIVRDQDYLSNIKGIYPCGEGAGYAGGITSAAMDGMKVAEAIIHEYHHII
ncbi:MAG: FAD-dependent oxidoreductase [Lachnospiraceae bacterium]|nr:FAD-dependent oxidoreductase [Lachnospiraceae bacterium]